MSGRNNPSRGPSQFQPKIENKPQECMLCGTYCSNKYRLARHWKTACPNCLHLREQKRPCVYPGCEKKFSRPDRLPNHLKEVHKMNPDDAKDMIARSKREGN